MSATRQDRSELVIAIKSGMNRKSWESLDDLTERVGHLVPVKQALKVYEQRIHRNEPRKVQVARGRRMQVLLTCITLVQYEKLLQRGRGDSKEYKLA